MKRIYTVVFCMYSLFCLIQCSDDGEVVEGKVKGVNLVFTTNGVAKTIYARFIYSTALGRYQLLSQDVVEIKALHEITGEVIYVYALKTGIDLHAPNGKSEIKTGYYGYSSGCFYFGTLYVGENGESIFVPASGINSIANPPICPGGEWA